MKKIIKGILLLLVIAVIALLAYVKLALPNVGEIEYLSVKHSTSPLRTR